MAGYPFGRPADSILDLPDDLLFSVCQFLPLTDLVNIRLVRFVQRPANGACTIVHCCRSPSVMWWHDPCSYHASLSSSRSAPCSRTWWTLPGTSRFGLALPLLTCGRILRALTAWASSPGELLRALLVADRGGATACVELECHACVPVAS